jgi:hypothetical protein
VTKEAKAKAASIKRMLTSDKLEIVDAGLSLFDAIADADVADVLLYNVCYVKDCIYGRLVPNFHFKVKASREPLLNHALLGVIRFSPRVA